MISRVNSKIEYKTDFLFIAAMNPCPCGNLFKNECRCTENEIKKYKNRISEPLLDRIELYVQMSEEEGDETISSKEIFEKVLVAFEMQKGQFNANLDENFKFDIENEAYELLQKAKINLNLSRRSEFNILKVSKTIANLDKRDKIKKIDIIKATKFRKRNY